jgi:hypothetical protein
MAAAYANWGDTADSIAARAAKLPEAQRAGFVSSLTEQSSLKAKKQLSHNVEKLVRAAESTMSTKGLFKGLVNDVDLQHSVIFPKQIDSTYSSVTDLAKQAGLDKADLVRLGMPADREFYVPPFYADKLSKLMQSFANPEGVLQQLDHYTGIWKRYALGAPSTVVRNMIGQIMQLYVGGVNIFAPDAVRAFKDSAKIAIWTMNPKTMEKHLGEKMWFAGANRTVKDVVEELTEYAVMGTGVMRSDVGPHVVEQLAGGKANKLMGVAKDVLSARKGPIAGINKAMSAVEDQGHAWAYMWGREQGMSPLEARKFMAKTVLDYELGLSNFEKNTMRRLLPFYSWVRLNIPAQLRGLVRSPSSYSRLVDIKNEIESLSDSKVRQSMLADWMRDKMPIIIGDKAFVLENYLPQADLGKIPFPGNTEKAGNTFIEMINPLLKKPVEQLMNKDFFSKQAISSPGRERVPMPLSPVGTIPARLNHMLQLFRPIAELQRLNPGNVFGDEKNLISRGGRSQNDEVTRALSFMGIPKGYAIEPAKLWLSRMAKLTQQQQEIESIYKYQKLKGADTTMTKEALRDVKDGIKELKIQKVKHGIPSKK